MCRICAVHAHALWKGFYCLSIWCSFWLRLLFMSRTDVPSDVAPTWLENALKLVKSNLNISSRCSMINPIHQQMMLIILLRTTFCSKITTISQEEQLMLLTTGKMYRNTKILYHKAYKALIFIFNPHKAKCFIIVLLCTHTHIIFTDIGNCQTAVLVCMTPTHFIFIWRTFNR